MPSGCHQENCTVATTGVCLLNNDAATCPNRSAAADEANLAGNAVRLAPPLKDPPKNPRFPLSLTLTPPQMRKMMGGRYCHLVGILGAPDAGKTAALVSLYLLTARSQLAGFTYADSRSLMAFDDISQGACRWNDGQIPEQLTVHTELTDERSAGFLHLRIKPADHGEAVDLLLPDLPGEWSTAMVDSARVDRLDFLKRADVVWLMVDGRQLSDPTTRQFALHRTNLLMQRLAALVTPAPPVILVVTRRDQGEPNEATLDTLRAEGHIRGLSLQIISIASFDETGAVPPGTGIAELITASILMGGKAPDFWPDREDKSAGERAMMRFRGPKVI
jgi:hypothetical protein